MGFANTTVLKLVGMSRHVLLPIKPEHQGYKIVVNWDSTLANFFGEMQHPRDHLYDLGGEVVVSVVRSRASATYEI